MTHAQIMFTLCTCAAMGRKEWLWAAGNWAECPCEFLSMSKRVNKWVDWDIRRRERDWGGRCWTLWASHEAEREGDDCVRGEGAIRLNEWLLSDQKCTLWKCPVYREGPCDHRPSSLEASMWSQTSWPTTKGSHCVATSPPIQQLSSRSANKHN